MPHPLLNNSRKSIPSSDWMINGRMMLRRSKRHINKQKLIVTDQRKPNNYDVRFLYKSSPVLNDYLQDLNNYPSMP